MNPKLVFRAPREAREMHARKPAHGSPCNNCGLCCYAIQCSLGAHVLGPASGRCRALRQTGEHTYECGVAADPAAFDPVRVARHGEEAMRTAALLIIGAGDGCDARFNGEWRSSAFDEAMDRLDYLRREEIALARAMWGMNPDGKEELPF